MGRKKLASSKKSDVFFVGKLASQPVWSNDDVHIYYIDIVRSVSNSRASKHTASRRAPRIEL